MRLIYFLPTSAAGGASSSMVHAHELGPWCIRQPHPYRGQVRPPGEHPPPPELPSTDGLLPLQSSLGALGNPFLRPLPVLPAPRAPRTPAPPSPLRGEDLVRVSVPSPGVKVNPTSGTPACLQALSSPPVPAPRAPQRRKQRLRQLQTLVADTQLAGGEGRCP